MRIGLNHTPEHDSPEQWGDLLIEKGYQAASFPVNYKASVKLIDAYTEAAAVRDIMIAEVGVWNSPHVSNRKEAEAAEKECKEQLALAEYVKAKCCVNVSGAAGDIWYACHPDNYSDRIYQKNVEFIQNLCDTVRPKHTCYVLEPMQWMIPDSPEQYLAFIKDVDRKSFAVHMDMINFIKDPYTYSHKEELLERCFGLLGPYIKSCHIKDCIMETGLTVKINEVPAGEGTMILGEYMKRISGLDGDIPVLLEHLPDMESYDKALKVCKSYL